MYESMFTIVVTITLTVMLILFISLRQNPLLSLNTLWNERKNRKMYAHLLFLGSILLLNKLELFYENKYMTSTDKSGFFFRYEQDFLHSFQQMFHSPLLSELTTFFYVIMFTALLFASIFVYLEQKETQLIYAFFYGIAINYLIAIPFYLFLPINEVWVVHPGVHFLIPEVYPGFETQYRHMSGLNNCFPSLHNSISLTLLLISLKSSNRAFKLIMKISVPIIMFSTIYLGIHWVTDMFAGIVLAVFASKVSLFLSRVTLKRVKPTVHYLPEERNTLKSRSI